MSNLKRYLGFAALLFVFIGGAAASEASGQVLNSILTRMDNHNKALTSLRADVTMVKENTQLRVKDTTEGKVLYVPQRNSDPLVRIDWRSPDETFAVAKGTHNLPPASSAVHHRQPNRQKAREQRAEHLHL